MKSFSQCNGCTGAVELYVEIGALPESEGLLLGPVDGIREEFHVEGPEELGHE